MYLTERQITDIIENGFLHITLPDASAKTGFRSYRLKSDTIFNRLVRRSVVFFNEQETPVLSPNAERIDTIALSSGIASVEYSTDGGVNWYDPVLPMSLAEGVELLWRVKTYNTGKISGNMIINSTIV